MWERGLRWQTNLNIGQLENTKLHRFQTAKSIAAAEMPVTLANAKGGN
jgi:hypothetical protein